MAEQGLVGRLAPSPTGAQHVGNARTYLFAWLSIRSRGGKIILRIEDLDSPRVKSWATQQAIDDLHWLGLDWDEGPDRPGIHHPYVQSQGLDGYRNALALLIEREMVYPCTCSRTDIREAASAPHERFAEPVYPGKCSGRRAADCQNLDQTPFAWRFRSSKDILRFRDGIAGECAASHEQRAGDFVVARSDGAPAYQLAVVVDDHRMGVTEVLRGDDLILSTFRQRELYEQFAWPPPMFAHVPLVVGPDGRRLAKRHGDTRLASLRDAGVEPKALVGLLAWSAGLADSPSPVAAKDLIPSFSLAKIRREPFVLEPKHLADIGYRMGSAPLLKQG